MKLSLLTIFCQAEMKASNLKLYFSPVLNYKQ